MSVVKMFAVVAFVTGSVFGLSAAEPDVIWTGAGADALASNPDNWTDGAKPTDGSVVGFSSDEATWTKPMTWDLDVKLGGWVQDGYDNTVTFETVYPEANLGTFTNLLIEGDVVLNTGTWTHRPYTTASQLTPMYRLCVSVAGDMTIGPNAAINADSCGYLHAPRVNGKRQNGTSGGSYGGHGGLYGGSVTYTYGSYSAPEEPGGGGYWSGTQKLPGGGAIKLEVAGALTHNGVISANSTDAFKQTYYLGAGGSVYVIAGTISGTGKMLANSCNANNCNGSGGRVAVKLTKAGADFSNYDILNKAEAKSGRSSSGGSGTIYAETAADTPGEGWLIMKGNASDPQQKETYANGDPFTYAITDIHVAKLTLTNRMVMYVGPGCTLDLRGTEVVAAGAAKEKNGLRVNGGTVVYPSGDGSKAEIGCLTEYVTACTIPSAAIECKAFGGLVLNEAFEFTGSLTLDGGSFTSRKGLTLTGDVTVKAGGTFAPSAAATVNGSVSVQSGGTVTHEGPSTTTAAMRKIDLHVTGDFTIADGGAVNADGMGYAKNYGPTGSWNRNCGVSHGGMGQTNGSATPNAAYGSIHHPAMAGSGSTFAVGGGIVVLKVDGALLNDGSITARGTYYGSSSSYSGAGGSIDITAYSLAGSGRIDAGVQTGGTVSATGGGRVAVTLTGAGSTFDGWADRITAFGNNSGRGGAGTVYLRASGQAQDEGTLLVRNGTVNNSVLATPLGGAVEGTGFGTVVISNAAVSLAADSTITVKGDWIRKSAFTAGAGSTVGFAGAAPSLIVGDTTFASLSCQTPGKKIAVKAGTTLTVGGDFNFSGTAGEPIELGPDAEETTWNLVNNGSTVVNGVKLTGCQATNPFTVMNGVDGGGNSENITFFNIVAGETNTWKGTVDSSWSNAANWDRNRAPVDTDNIVIDAGGNAATLAADVTAVSLTVVSGARLAVGDRTLTLTGDLDAAGAISASAGGAIVVAGDVTLSGPNSLAGSELRLVGTDAQTLAAAGGLGTVRVACPALTVATSCSCESFIAGAGARQIEFAAGSTLKATAFTVTGSEGSLITLVGANGATWNLQASRAAVDYASVGGSDASKGILVLPTNSEDRGGNVNWMFTDTRIHWDGTSETTAEDDVVIDPGKDYTITEAREMKSLTVSGGAKLTVNAPFALAGSVTVEDGAIIVWNVPGTIGGNLTVLSGGTITHTANSNAEVYALDLSIAGSGYIQDRATITAKGCGYAQQKGPGSSPHQNVGAAHGGCGYPLNSSSVPTECYGSILCPTNCGSGAGGDGWEGSGGGVVKLVFGGELALDGTVDADGTGNDWYSGSGGSVWITAQRLVGAGIISADGGTGASPAQGGGGRIALYLTGAGETFDGFADRVHAWGGLCSRQLLSEGSAGTVFKKTAEGRGTLFISHNPNLAFNENNDKTFFPSNRLCDPNEARDVDVEIDRGSLYLTQNYRVNSIKVSDSQASRILLNGHKLKVKTFVGAEERARILSHVIPGGTEENPGRLEWCGGLVIIIR